MTPWLGNHRPCKHICIAEGCVYCPRDRVLFIEPVAWLAAVGIAAQGTTSSVTFQVLAMRARECLPADAIDAYVWIRPGCLPLCSEQVPPIKRNFALITPRD